MEKAPTAQSLPFGPPPFLEGEDAAVYDELLISGSVKPFDFLEEIWIRASIDLTWDVFRHAPLSEDGRITQLQLFSLI
jgi:hypothetical protein